MADRSLYIELVVDDKGAAQRLQLVDASLRRIGPSAKSAEKDLGLFERAMVKATAVGTMLGNALYDLGRAALRTVVAEFKSAISESTKLEASLIGLGTVAGRLGSNVGQAREAAQSLAADGLMSVTEAATGLKNLLASGFSLPEAIQLMNGFKDSAAFGRQSSLEFGYAVVSATEGIKNQNSILVDNAGLTKNLSVIMKEAGMSVTDMARISSDAGVRAKFLGGLMKELALFTGDAAKMIETYQGATAKLNTQWTLTKATLGDAVTKNETLITAVNGASEALFGMRDAAQKNQGAMATMVSLVVIGAVDMATGVLAATEAIYSGVRIMVDFVSLDLKRLALQWLNTFGGMVRATEQLFASLALASRQLGITNSGYEQAWMAMLKARAALESAVNSQDGVLMSLSKGQEMLGDLRKKLEGTIGKLASMQDVETGALQRNTVATEENAKAKAKLAEEAAKRVAGWNLYDFNKITLAATEDHEKRMIGRLEAPMPGAFTLDPRAGRYMDLRDLERTMLPDFNLADAMRRFPVQGTGIAAPPGFFGNFMGDMKGGLSQTWKGMTGGQGNMAGLFSSIGGGIMTGGLNTLMNVGISLLGKGLGKLFGGGEHAKVNDTRDAFFDKHGGFDGLAGAGVDEATMQQLFNAKNVRQWESAVKAAEAAMASHNEELAKAKAHTAELEALQKKYGITWADFAGELGDQKFGEAIAEIQREFELLTGEIGVDGTAAVIAMKDEIVKLSLAAVKAGRGIPAAMAPWLRQLAEAGQLTEDVAASLLGLEVKAVPTWKELEDAAKRYGLELDKLGGGVKKIWSDETANQMAKDFKLFMQLGAPVNELLKGMQDEVQALVSAALEYGYAIPESLRPVLQKFIENESLVDKNGEKLKDLSQIKFEEPLVSAVDRLIEKLDELIDKFGEVQDAAGEASSAADGVSVPTPADVPTAVEPPKDFPEYVERFHRGGYLGWTRAHSGLAVDEVPIIAQRGEGILSRRGMQALGGPDALASLNNGGRGGLTVNANVAVSVGMSEEEIGRRISRQIVREMRKRGQRFN